MVAPRLLALLSVVALLGCPGELANPLTGIGGGTGTGGTVQLNGNWLYSSANLTSSPVTCSTSGTTLQLTQNGSTVTGTYSGGTITCSAGAGAQTLAIASGTVAGGALTGSSIAFDLDTSAWHSTGSVNGTTMSGTATLRVQVNGTSYTLTGTWTAAKQ
jgi:hypothetical protein